MSNDKQYSWNELVRASNDIDRVLRLSKDKESDVEELDRSLVFKLRTNQKKANEAIETLEEEFPEGDEKYDEFVQEKIELAREYDGDIQQAQGRVVISNYNEVSKNPDFSKKLEKLEKEYKEVIDAEDDRQKKVSGLQKEKNATIEWTMISLDIFPEKMGGDALPLSFIDFVIEE